MFWYCYETMFRYLIKCKCHLNCNGYESKSIFTVITVSALITCYTPIENKVKLSIYIVIENYECA